MRPKATLRVSGPSLRRSVQSAVARTRTNTGCPASAVDRPSRLPRCLFGSVHGRRIPHPLPRWLLIRKPRALRAQRLVTDLVANFLETGKKHATQ